LQLPRDDWSPSERRHQQRPARHRGDIRASCDARGGLSSPGRQRCPRKRSPSRGVGSSARTAAP